MNHASWPSTVAACAAYGLNVLLVITAVALIALVAVRSVLRHDASARYSLCLVALVCILLSPPVVFVLNHFGFGLKWFGLPGAGWPQPLPVTASTPDGLPAHDLAGWGVFPLLLSLWVVGAIAGAVRFVYNWRTAARLRRTAQLLEVPVLDGVREMVQRSLGAPLPPILSSKYVVAPVALGLLHSVVILPEGLAETLTPLQLRHVLLHECAHVALRHAFGGVVQRLVGLLYWPHPLIAVLCRELAQAREEVCDNVASQEGGATCYARTLLTIAQGLSVASQDASALALLGPETSLEKRISGLLDPRRNRMVGMKRGKVWALTSVVTVTMALSAAVRVVAAEDKGRPQVDQKHVTVLAKKSSNQPSRVVPDGKHSSSAGKQSSTRLLRVVLDGKHSDSASKPSSTRLFRVVLDSKHSGSAGN